MLNKDRSKKILLYGSMLIAIALGVYAQDIAYFLYENLKLPLLIGISISTILSILLFLSPPILVSKFSKENKMQRKKLNIYLGFNTLVGLVVSAFSLIVLIAWCG